MPELPEVEIIKRGLQSKIIGLKIKSVEVLSPKSFIGNSKILEGKIVLKIERRAKILVINLDGKNYRGLTSKEVRPLFLLFHLKMSGQLIWVGKGRFVGGHPTQDMIGDLPNKQSLLLRNKSTRVIFTFSDGSKLYFNDQRRFGWVRIVSSEQEAVSSLFKKLGPEPLEDEFTWEILKKNLLRHKNIPVKVALLDQSAVAGVGNIYASEACFNAKLDPRLKVATLSDKQFQALHAGLIIALKEGIKHGGSTKTHFVDAEGRKGLFLDYANVYNRDKKPCRVCGTEIKKIKLGGRGTYYCPSCQA